MSKANMIDCSASIVLYETQPEMVRNVASSFLSSSLNVELHLVDNSFTPKLKDSLVSLDVTYHHSDFNGGYGRGHNWIINKGLNSRFHIIINPDIIVGSSTIQSLCSFMEQNPNIGMVSPKIMNEDGTIQFSNKRYPTVFDLFARRFIPKILHSLIQPRMDRYEMKDVGYEEICDVECISGCFMFCRTESLKKVGGFDDRYFMYFEDFDLSRKMQEAGYRTVYYPHATVTHLWERASHKSLKMTWVHIQSAIAYFKKWGWRFF